MTEKWDVLEDDNGTQRGHVLNLKRMSFGQ